MANFASAWRLNGTPSSAPLVLVAVLILQVVPSVALNVVVPRWQRPCAGSSETGGQAPPSHSVGIISAGDRHRAISQQAGDARLHVLRPLLNEYDAMFPLDEATLLMMEMQLLGDLMQNISDSRHFDSLTSLRRQYDHLSHIAVFMEQMLEQVQHSSGDRLDDLFSINEFVLYTVLCAIKQLGRELGGEMTTHHTHHSMRHRLRQHQSEAGHWLRDYTVLRGLEKLLRRIESENTRLSQFELPQTGRRRRRSQHQEARANMSRSRRQHGDANHGQARRQGENVSLGQSRRQSGVGRIDRSQSQSNVPNMGRSRRQCRDANMGRSQHQLSAESMGRSRRQGRLFRLGHDGKQLRIM